HTPLAPIGRARRAVSKRPQMSHQVVQLLAVVRPAAARLDDSGLHQRITLWITGEAGQDEPAHLPIRRAGLVERWALRPTHDGVQGTTRACHSDLWNHRCDGGATPERPIRACGQLSLQFELPDLDGLQLSLSVDRLPDLVVAQLARGERALDAGSEGRKLGFEMVGRRLHVRTGSWSYDGPACGLEPFGGLVGRQRIYENDVVGPLLVHEVERERRLAIDGHALVALRFELEPPEGFTGREGDLPGERRRLRAQLRGP